MTPRGTPSPGPGPGPGPGPASGYRPRREPDRGEPDILRGVRARLATGEPLDLLTEVSSLVSAVDPRSQAPFARARNERVGGGEATGGRRSGRRPHPAAAAKADAEGRFAELPSLDDLVRSFVDVDRFETTALLAAIAVMAPDELVRARARREVAERAHVLPAWLAGLGAAHARRTMEMVHVLGDGDDLLIELELPGAGRSGAGRPGAGRPAAGRPAAGRGRPGAGRPGAAPPHVFTLVVYVDHNLGSVVKDAFPVPGPIDDLVEVMQAHAETTIDTTWRTLDPADAGARIRAAVDRGALLRPPLESDTWPACRPMVEWAARLLPPGGRGYEQPEWDDASKQALTEAFFASPMAAALGAGARELFDAILWFGTDDGAGDPLRWSPVSVEIFLTDWAPRKIVGPVTLLGRLPDVLRAFIAYAHAERGIRPALTAETLDALDRWEPEYRRAIGSPRPQGAAGLLAALEAIDPDRPWELPGWSERMDDVTDLVDGTDVEDGTDAADGPDAADVADPFELMLGHLEAEVGGAEALDALDARPLPDEPFAWEGVPADVAPKVAAVLAACDRCCDSMLDGEYRTACRRYLSRVARTAPEVFRRRGRADTAAAAVCWTVGKANGLFSRHLGGVRVKDLMGQFGLARGGLSQRAATMLQAAGIAEGTFQPWDVVLGDATLLVSPHRRRIIERRDALRRLLGDTTPCDASWATRRPTPPGAGSRTERRGLNFGD